MKLECTQCQARYTIDDAIVPAQGAKIRCRKCGSVISVPPAAAAPSVPAPTAMPVVPPTPAPAAVTPSRPITPSGRVTVTPEPAARASAPAPSSPSGFSFLGEPSAPPVPAAEPPAPPAAASPAPPPVEAPRAEPAPPAAPPGAGPTGTGIPADLTPEEKARHERARRLARVLASDIAIYNREKKDRGLAEGNLVAVLGYEIKKSWEIYKERVGADFANATPYFRNALNDLLAEGRKIF
jgi:predicted Zn finger-like uncharacterized protein